MPRHEFPRHHRRFWWTDPNPADEAQGEHADAQAWPEHAARFRPPWWPENEPWPPKGRHWPRGIHRPFFRRLGCLFLMLNLLGAAVLVTVILLVLNALGLTSISLNQVRWVLPFGGILLAVLISVIVLAATNLRRVSVPLDDMLAASQRVADGDYAVRVATRGPLEVRSLASAFNSMAERLQAHDRQRRSMLADVSHELRTPLTIIQGNLEGMLDGLYPPDDARLRSILEETQILSRLTDDLRTLALAETGALQLKPESTDLVSLLRETIDAFHTQAAATGVPVNFSTDTPEIALNIDPERIRQVASNLISNAVRYSPSGTPVRVNLSTQKLADEKCVTVSVADTGPGIAGTDLPHIFDRYYKSADSHGMGLGLSIARYIVEAHGGQNCGGKRCRKGHDDFVYSAGLILW